MTPYTASSTPKNRHELAIRNENWANPQNGFHRGFVEDVPFESGYLTPPPNQHFDDCSLLGNLQPKSSIGFEKVDFCSPVVGGEALLYNLSQRNEPTLPAVITRNTSMSRIQAPLPATCNEEWDDIASQNVNCSVWQKTQPLPSIMKGDQARPFSRSVSDDACGARDVQIISRSSSTTPPNKERQTNKKSWQAISAQICQFAQESMKNTGLDSYPKKEKSTDPTMLEISIREPSAFRSARNAFQRSTKSQKELEEWDKKMGLKRCHSRTMTKSSISRKRLLRSMQEIKLHQKRVRHAATTTP